MKWFFYVLLLAGPLAVCGQCGLSGAIPHWSPKKISLDPLRDFRRNFDPRRCFADTNMLSQRMASGRRDPLRFEPP